jgi:hypothetical protein
MYIGGTMFLKLLLLVQGYLTAYLNSDNGANNTTKF